MPYFSLDHCIVYASLLITLIVGLWSGRGIKTIREYATADKMFGTTALVLTFLATDLGGSDIIVYPGRVADNGIIVFITGLGFRISFILTGLFITPHIVHFTSCLTMGDLMQQLYGRCSGVLAGTLGLVSALCIAGMELAALGLIFEATLGIPAAWGIVLGGLILTFYSAHGGIKAVVTTDILQFLIMVVGLPVVAYIAIHHAGGIQQVVAQVPVQKLTIWNHEKGYYHAVLFLMYTLPVFLIDAAMIQRLLMSRTARQLRNQYLIASTFDFFFFLLLVCIGLAGIVLYPTIEVSKISLKMINQLLPIGIKGIAIAGIFALSMSTIDSFLHVAGLTLVHDVLKPLSDQLHLSIKNEYRWAQFATLVLGSIAIAIALRTTDLFGLFLDSLEVVDPFILFPLITGILGLKPEKKAFYTAMAVTIAVWGACKAFLPESYSYLTTLISILANGITFLGVHWRMNKGFKRAKRSTTGT